MESPLEYDLYRTYWFGTFAVVAVVDDGEGDGLREGRDWERVCLGTFYVKPNYPGISLSLTLSHFFDLIDMIYVDLGIG